ncbi:hypothetical protein [Pseudomonas peradeniyensis]|uniref:Uncharacterized protein n=1 Tax=Pseudomonas peradeniyensis TaxID=2745488 RepID=A0ABT2VF68_9PSED|nr:hypothetical protein [Pseudomonas peradeniyensis]MCU7240381.1 hypothetical protein [Pseudomonas peradeniyensis]
MTKAEQLLNATGEEIRAAALRREILDHATQFTLDDGSSIQCRKLSGRSAFARSGWHLKSN